MDNKLTYLGGEPTMREDDFLRIQKANREFIQYFLKDFGECIIAGELLTAPVPGNDLTLTEDAYIFLDGEVLKVDPDTYIAVGFNAFWRYEKVVTFEPGGDKTYLDGIPRQTWQKNRGVPVSVAALGAGDLDVIDGRRWNGILPKELDIPPWDMNTNISIDVAHGLSDHTKIIGVEFSIFPDIGTSIYNNEFMAVGDGLKQLGVLYIDATNVRIGRYTGGFFDAAGFSAAVNNRGKMLIKYKLH